MKISIRARTTTAFAATMLVLLAALAALAYVRMSSALLDEIDTGLRFRAVAALSALPTDSQLRPDPRLQEPKEAFEQVLSTDGRMLASTTGFARALLEPPEVARITSPAYFERAVPGVPGTARLLAVPARSHGRSVVLVVGASMSDRADALHQLATVLAVGGPVAVAAACLAAWWVAGWVLRPMERLRVQADAISASGADRRLDVPRVRDELKRLAVTLNKMLDRLAESMAGERGFLERAGHELRTPLAALRAEVDVALSRPRPQAELTAALRSVSEETDRLTRLADDLLVLARAADGRLPLRRERVDLWELLDAAAARFAAQAGQRGVAVVVSGAPCASRADPLRLRQVVDNLVANAARHAPHGGHVRLTCCSEGGETVLTVEDDGAGFDPLPPTPGLGLQIVRAIVDSHGGGVVFGSGALGGARVTVRLPADMD
jgi:two-component system OmpR family sensor kinase